MSHLLEGDEFHRSMFGFPTAWEPALFFLLLVYNLVCVAGILGWRRWGLLGFVATPAVVFVVNAAAGVHVLVMSGLLIPAIYAFFSSAALIGGGVTGRGARKRKYPWGHRYIDDELMASWGGNSTTDLIAIWGSPNRVMDDGEGGKIFIYIFDRASRTPAAVVTREFDNWFDGKDVRANYTPSATAEYLAFRMFWINPQNIVYRWAWTGE